MKKRKFFAIAMLGLAMTFGWTSCSEDNSGEDITQSGLTDAEMDAAINQYVNGVVLPTYKTMLENVTTFKEAVDKFVSSKTQEDLDAACAAWRNARTPWEHSEAHLGGPATDLNLDPGMDTWPLDKDGINSIIASGNFGAIEGDEEANQMLRGFHTAEYLIFYNGKARVVGEKQDEVDLTSANVLKYLSVVASDILRDTQKLYTAWNEGLPGDDDFPTAFGQTLIKHDGTKGYTSPNSVLAFILGEEGGMADIANEVGESKIGDPVTNYKEDPEKGLLSVESWYSWNSIDDYAHNIEGVRNCYLGSLDGKVNENSISALVKKVDASLDTEVQQKINAAIAAIRNIPAPFRDHLDATKYPQVTEAQNACAAVVDILKTVRTKLDAN